MKQAEKIMKDLTMIHFSDLQRLEIVSNRVSLKRLMDQSGFPAPIRLGLRRVAWRLKDVRKWVDERTADSGCRSHKTAQAISRRRFGLEPRS